MPSETSEDKAVLDDPNRGYYDLQGQPISLRKAMELKDKLGKNHGGMALVAEAKVNGKTIRAVWLGDAFEDELRSEKPEVPRVYGIAVLGEPFIEFRCTHLNVHQRHAEIVEALKQGNEAYEAVLKKYEDDRIT